MKPRARLAAAAASVVALVACVLGVQQMLPASAGTPAPSTRFAAAPPNLVQGVVVDQAGRPVDGVEVHAVKPDGSYDASDESYAALWEDGPGHGYFALSVHRGRYVVLLKKPGYKTVSVEAGQITKRIKKISLGTVEIQKIAAPTTTEATLAKARITTKETGSVTVTVTGDGRSDKVVGDVEIREGRTVVGTGSIGKKDKGVVTVTLKKLAKGVHDVTAYFLGTVDHKASSSPELTLTVTKKKR